MSGVWLGFPESKPRPEYPNIPEVGATSESEFKSESEFDPRSQVHNPNHPSLAVLLSPSYSSCSGSSS